MSNVVMMATEGDSGARKVGTYDIPEERGKGTPPPPPPERRSGLGWLWWLLGIILLLALLAWAFQSCMPAATPAVVPTAVPTAVPDAAATTAVEDAVDDAADTVDGAVAVGNAAVCTALTDYDTLVAGAPAITAETPVTEVRGYYDQVQAASTALTGAAAAVPDLDLTGFNTSLSALGASIAGLTGDVVGDAAEGLNAAFTGVTDAFGAVGTAAGCQ